MIRRAASMPAAVILLSALGCTALAIMLSIPNGNATLGLAAMWLSAGILFAGVGAIIVALRPENRVGLILSASGLLWATGQLAEQYAEYGYVTRPGSLPAPVVGAWYSEWFWIPWLFVTFCITLFLFPTGRLPSRRWRPAFDVAVLIAVAFTCLAALERELQLAAENHSVHNPIGILPTDDVEHGVLGAAMFILLPMCAVAALSSLVVRFRRSSGEERAQLKWFTYAGAVLVVGFILQGVADTVLRERPQIVDAVLFALVPISISLAVLRHRLYDIDVVINRTLVYGTVTALLAGVYVAGVVGIGGILRELTQQENNSLAVAASTLAVAALFRPARARIQGFIDRRFYRRKYDAVKTLESFSTRLRDEIDLDELSADLLGAIKETMQPAHASLWLRQGDGSAESLPHRNDFETLVR